MDAPGLDEPVMRGGIAVQADQRLGAADPRLGDGRVEPGGGLIFTQRLIELTCGAKILRQAKPRLRHSRIGLRRQAIARDRVGPASPCIVYRAEAEVRL